MKDIIYIMLGLYLAAILISLYLGYKYETFNLPISPF